MLFLLKDTEPQAPARGSVYGVHRDETKNAEIRRFSVRYGSQTEAGQNSFDIFRERRGRHAHIRGHGTKRACINLRRVAHDDALFGSRQTAAPLGLVRDCSHYDGCPCGRRGTDHGFFLIRTGKGPVAESAPSLAIQLLSRNFRV